MAYKEVFRVEITEVIRQWQAGRGIREVAEATGLARNTTRKYILQAESCELARDGPSPTESQVSALMQLNRAGPWSQPEKAGWVNARALQCVWRTLSQDK